MEEKGELVPLKKMITFRLNSVNEHSKSIKIMSINYQSHFYSKS